MAAPALTYTLTNGSIATATYVQQNFTDLLNGITDGTKDLTISALTTNGLVSLGASGTLDYHTVNGPVNILTGRADGPGIRVKCSTTTGNPRIQWGLSDFSEYFELAGDWDTSGSDNIHTSFSHSALNIMMFYKNGQVRFGSAAVDASTPILSREGDTDTGLAFGAANEIYLQTGGTNRFQVSASDITTVLPITITTTAGPQLVVKDTGTFGTDASSYITFRDTSNLGAELGFAAAAENNFYISNRRSTGKMYLMTNATVAVELDKDQNIICGSGALATNATNGFIYLPSSAGNPTGTPTSVTGRVPFDYDTTNDVAYVYNSSWIKVGKKQTAIGTASTSTSAANSNTSFTAFDTSPSLTFTASRSGRYKVYCNVPYFFTGTAGRPLGLKIVATSGSPTTDFNGEFYAEISSVTSRTVMSMVEGIFTLTKGTSYTFQLQGKVGNAADAIYLSAGGPTNGVAIIAEEMD